MYSLRGVFEDALERWRDEAYANIRHNSAPGELAELEQATDNEIAEFRARFEDVIRQHQLPPDGTPIPHPRRRARLGINYQFHGWEGE